MSSMRRNFSRATLVAFVLGAGFGIVCPAVREFVGHDRSAFVSPASAGVEVDDGDRARIATLEGDLRATLSRHTRAGVVSSSSVTFRDLEGGHAFSIDGDAQFAPASLLKLPFAIAVFVMDEEAPGFLQHELRYARDEVVEYDVPAQSEVAEGGLVHGKHYSVEALLRHVIANSDNLAYYLVLQHLMAQPAGPERFARTLRELGARDPQTLLDEVASTREYSEIFRRLYSASYLSVEASELLLSWLGSAAFDSGIASGVPKKLRVANKFGERFLDDGAKQLHDCGIVYAQSRPYVLCVMTKGTDFGALRGVIADVSRQVHTTVQSLDR
jgi:beta-lactamase class A